MKFCINNVEIRDIQYTSCEQITQYLENLTLLDRNDFYLEQNGKLITPSIKHADPEQTLHCRFRVCGGKGGFGSMLRAIGAQIEKTTNREACRDLSGRRLRDINEEKRLKAWIDKQEERDHESEQRRKRKIDKLLAVPKHEFKDEGYERARSKLTEKVNDAVEEGFKKTQVAKKSTDGVDKKCLKRQDRPGPSFKAKKKKTSLWIGDDISDSDDSDDSSVPSDNEKNKKSEEKVTAIN